MMPIRKKIKKMADDARMGIDLSPSGQLAIAIQDEFDRIEMINKEISSVVDNIEKQIELLKPDVEKGIKLMELLPSIKIIIMGACYHDDNCCDGTPAACAEGKCDPCNVLREINKIGIVQGKVRENEQS